MVLCCFYGQTAGGGSIPRWSTGKASSGDPPKGNGRRPKKKNGAVLLLSPAGMALCVSVFLFLCLVFFLLWPYQDDDT